MGVEVQAWVAATNAPFRFQFPNPYEFTLPPKNDGTIMGFDVGLAPVAGHPMTKDSVRMLCIPPEEGYGTTAREGVPPNSTLIIKITCKEIILPAASPDTVTIV